LEHARLSIEDYVVRNVLLSRLVLHLVIVIEGNSFRLDSVSSDPHLKRRSDPSVSQGSRI
jgi:hypothetical protein